MDPILGMIILWPGVRIPSGWLPCDGRALPIATNAALYSLIGLTYGGDGQTNFNLPDLRSMIPMGVDPRLGGQGAVGKKTGAATASGNGTMSGNITIGVNNLPPHTHGATFTPGSQVTGNTSVVVSVPALTTAGSTAINAPGPTTVLCTPSMNVKGYNTANADTNLKPFTATGTVTVPASTGSVAIENTGGGIALPLALSGPVSGVSTVQPSMFLNYLIAVVGIYPTFD
jgi:microcystin-dependent protein